MELKTCSKCGEEKLLTEFYSRKDTKSGYRSHCNICISKYQIKNIDRRKKYVRSEHHKKRRGVLRENKVKTDIQYKIRDNLRCRLYSVLKGTSSKCFELVGCNIKEFKHYLESQFTEGMSWENHSFEGWHVDHIKPCLLFDLTKKSEQKKCFHYSNIQPLWGKDNMKKGYKYDNG